MLTNLQIENFTIVESLNIDFSRGLIALTGETGAGKSILLDALGILLGQKSPGDVIRPNAKQCQLIAEFDISTNPSVKTWLDEQSLDNEGEIIIRRVLSEKGRSKSFINGILFPITKIKEIGEALLHIHGQHQQHHLLKSETQLEQLDAYANLEQALLVIKACFNRYQETKKALETLEKSLEHVDKKELLRYQLDELNDLALSDNEVENLMEEHKTYHQASEIKNLSAGILSQLDDSNESTLLSQLQTLFALVETLPEKASNIKSLISSALISCEEAKEELQNFFEDLSISPEKAAICEKRLDSIHQIARKHQVQASHLFNHHQQLLSAWQKIENADESLNALKENLKANIAAYQKDANHLSDKRQKAAHSLEKALTKSIRQLGIPQANLAIEINQKETISPKGQDMVNFLVAPNPGLEAKPLAKIASGGELSRISLAIQVLTAEKKTYPTLIFDEVDTGIGGKTAANVGALLRKLGKHTQVFCITHQAQVAAFAHKHYKVSKSIKKGQTFSQIAPLNEAEKIQEIARMMGGLTLTEQTLLHAKELVLSAEEA